MSRHSHPRPRLPLLVVAAALVGAAAVAPVAVDVPAAQATAYSPISGTGSTWAQTALDGWRKAVSQNDGMTVNYSGVGSSAGRQDFINQTVDFSVSELPFQAAPADGSAPEVPPIGYTYIPLAAGATSLAYNLHGSDGTRITNLRLSDATVAGIFTGGIRFWNDPAIVAQNPGAALPAKAIMPVVRSDGSGSTWQFTNWMRTRQPEQWTRLCTGADVCPATSQFPVRGDMKAQNGSLGVIGYVSQAYAEGGITYVEESYARNSGMPVAKLLNDGGYYVAPTADAVSIALLGATVDADTASPEFGQLQMAGVYSNPDRRAYPLSSATYLIAPTQSTMIFNESKGEALGAFTRFALCLGQQQADELGYAPLPLNLTAYGLDQLSKVPAAGSSSIDGCANPTFVAGDTVADSHLTRTVPMPPASDGTVWSPPTTDRIGGADRYAAAVNVSKAAFPGTAPVVYIATGANYPDALSAGPAAAHEGGPLLLTDSATLLPTVAAEIRRLRPSRIVVVGGVNSVSDAVVASLRSIQSRVERIGGADRYEASRNLAEAVFGAKGAGVAYVATGANFPDALSAGAAAAAQGGPVVLVNGGAASIDTATNILLDDLKVQKIVIAGGPVSVSPGVAASLQTVAPTTRRGGADRFEASAAINAEAFPSPTRAFLATGLKFPDALAASAWAGAASAPLYVASSDCVPGAVLEAMRAQRVERVTLIGGVASLSERVAALTPC